MGSIISKIYDDYDDYEEMCRLVDKKAISIGSDFYTDMDNMLKEAEVTNKYDFMNKMKKNERV